MRLLLPSGRGVDRSRPRCRGRNGPTRDRPARRPRGLEERRGRPLAFSRLTAPARRRRRRRRRGARKPASREDPLLLQPRPDRLRLVRQHDHALAAGALASAWRDPRTGAGLGLRTVLATALHDLAWREIDDEPRWNAETGRPFGFDEHPLEEKLAAYREGLDQMEAISPWIGLAGSLHYASFLEEAGAGDFLRAERDRRRRLADRLRERAAGGDPLEEVRQGVSWLKLFDAFSIRLCLAPPAVPDEELPGWMDRRAALRAPDGTELGLRWEDGGRVTVRPWPFGGPVTLEVPHRELPAGPYPDAAALRRAWEEASERTWRLALEPPS